MDAERWQRIEQIYHAAVVRDRERRASLLAEACSDDAELRREVELLLEANERAEGFMAVPAMELEARNLAADMPGTRLAVEPGQELSHYKILSRIGGGGMGEVFLAQDTLLDRKVAIKFLPSYLEADEMAKKRLLREAKAAASLDHPNICTIYEVGNHGEIPYIAMQRIEGESIHQALSRGPLSVERALKYALDIADALNEAHRRGIIHRDIKPSNIMVNDRDRAVVLDFGLAKQVAMEGPISEEAPTLMLLTSEMTIMGTIGYMSPEQVRREPLDSRSDIFSLGVLLYEMLTGVRPFAARDPLDVLHATVHQEPKPVSQVRPQTGTGLDAIIQRCLEKERERRYQSLLELKSDLIQIVEYREYKTELLPASDDLVGNTRPGAEQRTSPGPEPATKRLTATITSLVSSVNLRVAPVVLAVVVAGASAWWLFIKPATESDAGLIGSLTHTQLINWKDQGGTLQDSHGVLSPDGKVIAYRSREMGRSGIWTRQISGGDAREVVTDEWNNWSPIWSPDGQEIAFLSSRGKRLGIWRIPAFGGTPTPVTSLDIPSTDLQLQHWSKDGETIYFKTDENLFSIGISTNAIRQITSFDPSILIIRQFSISPREDQIAYVDRTEGRRDLWVMPISGVNPARITNDPEEDHHPVWHPDGKRIIYSSMRDGVFQLYIAYIDARKPVRITTGDNDSFVSDVSGDGTKILYSSSREESDIWAINEETGEEYQITADVGAELWSHPSPDGKRIAFQSVNQLSQSGNISKSKLLVKPLGSDRGQIRLVLGAQEPRWSPDNQKIAFLRAAEFGATIWSVEAVGGGEKQLTGRSVSGFSNFTLPYNRFTAGDFSWSPDGNKVCFCSEQPEPGLWVCDAEDSREVKITGEPGAGITLSSPFWSPDGAHIAYLSTVQGEKPAWHIRVSDARTGESKTVYQANSVVRLLGWSPDGGLFLATIDGKQGIWPSPARVTLIRVALDQGSARAIATIDSTYLYTTHLSPDGRLIGLVSRQEGKGNIWAVSTQDGKARKLTANNDPKLYFSTLSWSPDSKTIYFDKQSRFSLISIINNFK